MRRILRVLLAIGLCTLMVACGKEAPPPSVTIKIGVTLYDEYDTFIGELTDRFVSQAREREQTDGITITVLRENADGYQEVQNAQVQRFIDAGCDVICVNLVDRMDASVIIDRAQAAGIPVIFFNRELVKEDLHRGDRLYYVGAEAEQSGVMQGKLVVDLWRKDAQSIDKNGDGILQYVMLEGQADHQDAVVRTESSIKVVTEAGIAVERLEDEIANWMRSQAKTKMAKWIEIHGDAIEVIFANNDDMALGAIDALKDAAIPPDRWPVTVGIDGTPVGLQAVLTGEMSGTVYNDARGQAGSMLELAYACATGGPLPELSDGKYIRLPYRPVTPRNVTEFLESEKPPRAESVPAD